MNVLASWLAAGRAQVFPESPHVKHLPFVLREGHMFLHENSIVHMKYYRYIEDMFREGKPFSINREYKFQAAPRPLISHQNPSLIDCRLRIYIGSLQVAYLLPLKLPSIQASLPSSYPWGEARLLRYRQVKL